MTTKSICRGGQCYVSPSLEVLDLKNEGVLCGSGTFGIKDWESEGDDEALGV